MQSQSLRTCPSKAFGLYASIEWGLSGVTTLSPFSFTGSKDGKELTFHSVITEAEGYSVPIPEFAEQFLILCIANKKGDNCVVLTHQDCKQSMGEDVDFNWIAQHLKRKFHVQYSPATDIFADARHTDEEG